MLSLSQQPLRQLLASQTQLPCAEHSWPALHSVQATPLAPQRVMLSLATVTHVPLLQHPAQLLPPHKHPPALHAWPWSHAPQTWPPEPHCASGACASKPMQSPSLQQPGHNPAVLLHRQVPLVVSQAKPGPHAAQATPPTPHVAGLCASYAMHVFPSQQPLKHDARSQTQPPSSLHSCPGPHATQATPRAPQLAVVGTVQPPSAQHPVHEAPQEQMPAVQLCPREQVMQAPPSVPHADPPASPVWQAPLVSQQPWGQVVAPHGGCASASPLSPASAGPSPGTTTSGTGASFVGTDPSAGPASPSPKSPSSPRQPTTAKDAIATQRTTSKRCRIRSPPCPRQPPRVLRVASERSDHAHVHRAHVGRDRTRLRSRENECQTRRGTRAADDPSDRRDVRDGAERPDGTALVR